MGTTTEGADLSTIIPAKVYSEILEEKLHRDLTNPSSDFPLFLIDSEGMGVRGDKFDFVATTPPAVISKQVVWVGEGKLETADVLEDINDYLNGLDNIIMDSASQRTDTICEQPRYGHFFVVINKLMDDTPDEELYHELMTPEPDYIDGAEDRNLIRQKMRECFDGLSVHGLPYLTLEDGQDFGYDVLNDRFRDGLAAMANVFLDEITKPKVVTIAGVPTELNSTNAETIISMVIDEANKGQIDLTGYSAFLGYISSQVETILLSTANEIEIGDCQENSESSGYICTPCVCAFRGANVDSAAREAESVLESAFYLAQSMFGVDATPDLNDIYNSEVQPWSEEYQCSGTSQKQNTRSDTCDLSTMNLQNPGNEISLTCLNAFLCDTITLFGSEVIFAFDNVYIAPGTILEMLAENGADGSDGVDQGDDGVNGEHGPAGSNMTLSSSKFLPKSYESMQVFSYGGNGGKGGNGREGYDGDDGDDGANGNCTNKCI